MATVLKMLLEERHLENHSDFLAVYDRCAAQLDPPVSPGNGPAKTQYYQWLSGRMIGLPRDCHCRVLAKMFPGWRIERLFQMVDAAPGAARAQDPGFPATEVQLEDFLGADVLTSGIVLVYPPFDLPTHPVPDLRDAAVPDRRPVGSKVRALAADHLSDELVALPEREFRGLLYVFAMLQGHADIVADIRSDRDVAANSDCPYISFGLTANDCTRTYLESVDRPLFTLSGGAEGDSHFDRFG